MELITAGAVSKNLGVSTRMLRYYEQAGLIKSQRTLDYAYRVYDGDTIRRLRQIIILRKLRVPVRQIREIFDNNDAVKAIEVFERNISELDEEITALATVKSILANLVRELREIADVRLPLDLLGDSSVFTIVDGISLPNNILEEKRMNDLNQASKVLGRRNKLLNMRGIEIPRFRAVSSGLKTMEEIFGEGGFQSWLDAHDHFILKQITDEPGFFWEDPPEGNGKSVLIRPIKDGVTEADVYPYELMEFPGGLYLVATGDENDADDINETIECMMDWINSHDEFEHGTLSELVALCNRPAMCNMPNVGGAFDSVLGIAQQQIFIPLKLKK
ncbi:MAG: MerR family transcriptional regulator [Defluviitaleaceae bacterium]|nr:MerR family transcriptional regulator [Defluviitaleaceae bacterium]